MREFRRGAEAAEVGPEVLVEPGLQPAADLHLLGHLVTEHQLELDALALITALVLLGQVLELRARSRTNAAIRLLLGLAPKTARLIRADDAIEELENVPAYVRKQIPIDHKQHSEDQEVSRYRLTDDGDPEEGPKLRPDNGYLHDNVD